MCMKILKIILPLLFVKSVIIICLLLTVVTAQLRKGDKWIGGNLSFAKESESGMSGTTPTYSNTVYYSVRPTVGLLLGNKWGMGISMGYSGGIQNRYTSGNYPEKSQIRSLVPGLLFRRFSKITDKFWFVTEGNLSYSSNIRKQSNYTSDEPEWNESTMYIISAGIIPSFIFIPSPSWGFEFSPGRLSYQVLDSRDSKKGFANYLFDLEYGQLNLAINYYIRGKKEKRVKEEIEN